MRMPVGAGGLAPGLADASSLCTENNVCGPTARPQFGANLFGECTVLG